MNRCTIFEFRNAMALPYKLLAQLSHADIDISSLTRTRYFAECHATLEGDDILIYAPIDEQSIHLAHRANIALQPAYKEGSVRLEILANELEHSGFDAIHTTTEERCPIVIERLPKGVTLEVAMNTMSRERMLHSMKKLDTLLRRLDISHNNLTPNNIIVDDEGCWHPIRQYYTCRGYGGDAAGFKALREMIIEYTTPMEEVDISALEPWNSRGVSDINPLLEGRRQITTGDGIGFEDEFGEVVIAPQYIWASDFMEKRAVVRTKENRMGLIDSKGREIIPTIYDHVEYSAISGKSIVQCNKLCCVFDYNGTQITSWHEITSDNMASNENLPTMKW